MKSKAKLLFMALAAMIIAACSEKPVSPDTPYVIEGEVTGIDDGVEIILAEYDGLVGTRIATDTLTNGKFHFKEVMREPELNWLSVYVASEKFPSMPCWIYVAPGAHIRVIGRDNHVYTWDVESKVSEQQANNELLKVAKAEYDEYQSLLLASRKASKAFQAIDRDKEPERRKEAYNHYMDINNQMDSLYVEIQGKEIVQMRKMKPSKPWLREMDTMSQTSTAYKDYKYRDDVIALYK